MYRDRPRDSQAELFRGAFEKYTGEKTGRPVRRRRAPAIDRALRNLLRRNGLKNSSNAPARIITLDIAPGGNVPAHPAARLADRLLKRVMVRETISKGGSTGMPGHRAILIFVTGLGLAFCPLTRAAQSVTLAWNLSPDSSVAGYMIGCGSDGTNYNSQVDAGNTTSWRVTGLQDGSTNYFEVTAYDVNHNVSPPSNPVKYVAPRAAQTLQTAAPAVTTQPATGVTAAVATLNASVDPNLSATIVYFEYGPTTAYGNFSATNTLASDLADAQPVALGISGMPSGSTLHFQAVAQNSFGTSFGGDLTLVTLAAGPVLAAIPDQFVNVGSSLLITNIVAEVSGSPGSTTFSLGPGAPAGAAISPEGFLEWTPVCEQGSTTNLITVWASDNGTPALSSSVSFNVIVSPCVEVTVGSSVALIGNDTSVPVSLFSTVSLTNVNFSLAALAGRFTSWSVTAGDPGMVTATVQASDPSQPRFNFAVQNGQALRGATPLGTIGAHVVPAGDSAFVKLMVNNIAPTDLNNTLVAPDFGQPGRVVLIGAQPLLEISLTNSNPAVTLYGNPGINYVLLSANSLLAQGPWTPFTNLTLATAVQVISPASIPNPAVFFRAVQP
jgi:hypothetical protein